MPLKFNHNGYQLGRKSAQVRSAAQTNVEPSRCGEMAYDEGLYSASQFVVELERGDKRALYTLMEKTIEIWEAQLSSAGL